MLDIKFIRENPEKVKKGIEKKRVQVDIDRLLELDKKRRDLLQEIERLRAEQNEISEKSKASQKMIDEARRLKREIKEKEPVLVKIEKEIEELVRTVPNLPFDEVPVGKDENDNKVLRRVGKKPKFNFKPKDYLEIAEKLDIIDVKRAAKVSGSRFGYLKGGAALLELALIQFAFKLLTKEGFIPVIPPVMIKEKPYMGMGRLAPSDREERYYIPKDKLYLVGSAEHTLGPMHMDEILSEKELPKRYVGFSTCFRREAGAYGKDTRGILRVHQFDKVEMFSFTTPEESNKEHEFLLSIQEKIMQALDLPYQVVLICTGDMGFVDAKQYDIETWLPSQNRYRETHSCSNTTDYQARGINCRYRKNDGALEFVHMLNATGCAIGRTIIAIIENYQQEDGSVMVPEVLKEYLGGLEKIG